MNQNDQTKALHVGDETKQISNIFTKIFKRKK